MKLPTLNIDQKIIAIILLTLIVVGAALGADYQALWPREKDLVAQPGKEGGATGVFDRRGGRGWREIDMEKKKEEEVRGMVWVG
jgi:hypothetical protein